jgi:hypothetical protein
MDIAQLGLQRSAMKNWMFHLFVVGVLLLVHGVTVSANDDLRAQLPPLSTLLSPAGGMQFRFQQVTEKLKGVCSKGTQTACLWGSAVSDLHEVSSKLSKGTSQKDLFLALSARVYPRETFEPSAAAPSDTFDSLYGRYLMSLRIVRELWPTVRQLVPSNSQLDEFIEAWLSMGNGWTFAAETLKNLKCESGQEVDCKLYKSLLRTLKAAVRRTDEDPNLAILSRLNPDADFEQILRQFRSQGSTNDSAYTASAIDRRGLELENILASTLQGESNSYLFDRDMTLDTAALNSLSNYFADLKADVKSTVMVIARTPKGDSCGDFGKILTAAREVNYSWVGRLRADYHCADRTQLIRELREGGLLESLELLQVRMSINDFYEQNRTITPEQIHFRMDQRNVRELVDAIRWVRTLPDDPLDRFENNDWTKFLLLNFYATAEGSPL